MKPESKSLLQPDNTAAAAVSAAWPVAAVLGIAAVLVLFVLYWQTAWSTVAIWRRSETFAHGFLIFPISIYLIWTRRHALAVLEPKADWRGLAVLAGLGFGWLLANLAGVLVVEQFALVAMIPTLVWTLLGLEVAWSIAFPLAFLFFAVPVGEALIPPMMEFTADFTVMALQLTGIPVYREGLFFTIPSGEWSVVEGCSGLRYLIASFTLGTLYGYLTYRSTARRIVFAALAVVVPIIANGLRAYMIVMIAHLSDMRLALGVDHYIYGWVFFGLVMLLLFWIGSFWREDEAPVPETERVGPGSGRRTAKLAPVFLAALAVGAIAPAYAAYLARLSTETPPVALNMPQPAAGWELASESVADWQPRYLGADALLARTYRKGDRRVALFIPYYTRQRQGAELINTQNLMVVQKHPVWSDIGESRRTIETAAGTLEIQQTRLRSPSQNLLVWHWNWLNGEHTLNPYAAKLLEAKAKLLQAPDDAAAVIIAAPYEDKPERAAMVLEEFARDMLRSIEASLETAARQ
ncbi:MAG: exosortase A [Pseudomonadota bacterium]